MAVNDLVTGSVLGNEFDIGVIEAGLIRLRIDGTSITRAVDGTLSSRPPLAVANVTAGQDINDDGVIQITSLRADAGWAIVQDELRYTGTPDRVRVTAHIHQTIAETANAQRPAPVLELLRNGVIITSSATGYIRDSADHEESSNTIVFVDPAPGANPVYEIQSRQESTNGSIVTVVTGQFSGEAVL